VCLDPSAERITLVDERGETVPPEQTLLLFLRLLSSNGLRGRLAFPVTVTSLVEDVVSGSGLVIERTPASLAALTQAASRDGVVFAGSASGGFVFPDILPGYDGVASLCKLLELLAPLERPLSELVAEVPRPAVRHLELRCPYNRKGAVMRILTERMKGRRVDTLDGLKVFDGNGWAQVLPDPAEPVVHVYAEGRTDEEAARLEKEFAGLVQAVIADES
jgi:mannose-1-phosphate guanylyltransferase/phosphomannomutase